MFRIRTVPESLTLLPSLSIKGLACATRHMKDFPSTHKTRKPNFLRDGRFFRHLSAATFVCRNGGFFFSKLSLYRGLGQYHYVSFFCAENWWYSKSSWLVMNCSLQRFTPTPGGGKRHQYKMGPGVSWSWVKVDWVDSLREWFFLHSQKLTMHFLLKMGIFPMSS